MRLVFPAGLALATSLWPQPAAAQANFGSELLGGAGYVMGGTGAAVGTDPTVPLLNPARLTHVPDKSFGIARFIHGRAHIYDNFYDPERTGDRQTTIEPDDLTSDAFDLAMLLGGLCFVTDFGTGPDEPDPDDAFHVRGYAGHHQVGFCGMPTEIDSFSGTALHTAPSPSVQGSGTVVGEWVRRMVGFGWAWNITDDFSVGSGLFLGISRYKESITGSSTFFDGSSPSLSAFGLDASGRSFDLVGHLGVSYRLGEHVTMGAAVRLPSLNVDGSWTSTRFRARSDGLFSRTTQAGAFTTNLPTRVVLGAGLHFDDVRAEIQGTYFFPQSDFWSIETERDALVNLGGATDPGFVADRSERAHPVANLGLGFEWHAFERLGFVSGFSTDFAAIDPIVPENAESRIIFRRLDRYHGSAGFSLYGDVGQLITAARLIYGRGEIRSTDPLAATPSIGVVNDTELAFVFHISGRVDMPALAGDLLSFK